METKNNPNICAMYHSEIEFRVDKNRQTVDLKGETPFAIRSLNLEIYHVSPLCLNKPQQRSPISEHTCIKFLLIS